MSWTRVETHLMRHCMYEWRTNAKEQKQDRASREAEFMELASYGATGKADHGLIAMVKAIVFDAWHSVLRRKHKRLAERRRAGGHHHAGGATFRTSDSQTTVMTGAYGLDTVSIDQSVQQTHEWTSVDASAADVGSTFALTGVAAAEAELLPVSPIKMSGVRHARPAAGARPPYGGSAYAQQKRPGKKRSRQKAEPKRAPFTFPAKMSGDGNGSVSPDTASTFSDRSPMLPVLTPKKPAGGPGTSPLRQKTTPRGRTRYTYLDTLSGRAPGKGSRSPIGSLGGSPVSEQ